MMRLPFALRLLRSLPQFSEGRVEWGEFLANVAGAVEGVDLTSNGDTPQDHDYSEPEPLTPYERLVETPGVVVSRDFRDLEEWDRTRTYDWRKYGWPGDKSRGQSRGKLAWSKITTIVLHTAGAVNMHPDRWLGVPSHCAVANDATAVLQHRLDTYLWAAHAANKYSMSLEVAGSGTITKEQVVTARALMRYMHEERQRNYVGQMYVAPHRFSHSSRAKDCGALIWREVGEWAMSELGLELGPVVGSGKPLPFPR